MQLSRKTLLLHHTHGCSEGFDKMFSLVIESWVVGGTAGVLNSVRCQVLPKFLCNKLWTDVRYQLEY